MRFWFIPCWSGDFRLEARGDTAVLTVEDPTPTDREKLGPFLKMAVAEGWADVLDIGFQSKGLTTIPLRTTMAQAGPALAIACLPRDVETWTAVRSTDGKVVVENGTQGLVQRLLDAARTSAAHAVDAIDDVMDTARQALTPPTPPTRAPKTTPPPPPPEAAVTLAAPRLGCPAPVAAERRASEVLRTFCTVRQYNSFQSNGSLLAYGNRSGRPYRIFHRGRAAALGLGHNIVDVTTQTEVCVWDDSVPAEEEMLGLKLLIEHHEERVLGDSIAPIRAIQPAMMGNPMARRRR